jgi:hypothetical protein
VHGIAEITDRIPKKTVFTRFGPNSGPGREIIEENYCSVKIEKGAYE